ncbi:MAG: DUF421 domain-containing protein [Sulfitobacter sp.]|nr:DUF421 domain-containing protein [Sulfitobacter sp.]
MSIFLEILMRAALVIAAIILLTRIHGLRSFSKMSGFDFAITVSVGSVLAGVITTLSTPLWHFVAALIALFIVQIILSQGRARWDVVGSAIDNAPLLVMENGEPIVENLTKGGMTLDDLWAKLREANAFDLSQVRAVILESTGDVSVLHGPPDGPAPCTEVMEGVRRR